MIPYQVRAMFSLHCVVFTDTCFGEISDIEVHLITTNQFIAIFIGRVSKLYLPSKYVIVANSVGHWTFFKTFSEVSTMVYRNTI